MSAPEANPGPRLDFTFDKDASLFAMTPITYKATQLNDPKTFLATGALVFDTIDPTHPRVLLLQRAAGDSMPNLWELPGGGTETTDPSILHAVARELWEEAGLEAAHISAPVGETEYFQSSSGNKICKLNFLVRVQRPASGGLEVKLDTNEHQDFVWATEEEVRDRRRGKGTLEFTNQGLVGIILNAFEKIKLAGQAQA